MDLSKENCIEMRRLVEDDWGEPTATVSKEKVVKFLKAVTRQLPSTVMLNHQRAEARLEKSRRGRKEK